MYTNIEQNPAKRPVALMIVAGLILVGLALSPAAADQPTEYTDSVTFSATNPCTELEHEVTINAEIRAHQQHNGNFVAHVKRTGTTDDGYVMDHGVENFQVNGNVARGTFTDIWRNDDGSKFKAQGVFVDDLSTGELLVDRFSISCIGN